MAGPDIDALMAQEGIGAKPFQLPQAGSSDIDSLMAQEGIGENQSLLKQAGSGLLSGISAVGKKIDSYTGAPVRSAIGAAQEGKNPLSEYASSFGRDPSLAPSGSDIADKAGVSSSVQAPMMGGKAGRLPVGLSNSEIIGSGIDIASDPTLIAGPAFRGVGKIAESVGPITKGAQEFVGAANTTEKVGSALSNAGTKITTKIGNMLSGVPEKEIETYIKSYPEVQKLIKDYGADTPGMADKIREGFQTSIRAKKNELSNNVSKALDALPNEKAIDSEKILGSLESNQAKLIERKQFGEASEIQKIIDKVKSFGVESDPVYGVGQYTGKVTPKELNSIKSYLQDVSSGAYIKDGQIFTHGSASQNAAKSAGREARIMLDSVSPEVAKNNQQLSLLHTLEQKTNKNLIAPGNTESALLAAGSGVNQRNVKNLQRLEDLTGAPILKNAENMSAAKRFGSPGFSSADTTGKGVERVGKGGLIGGVVGASVGAPLQGAFVGAALTSPAALKMAIQTGRVSADAVRSITKTSGKITDATIQSAYNIINSSGGNGLLSAGRALSEGSMPSGGLLQTAQNKSDRKPAKGKK